MIIEEAFAKINLSLDVCGKRPDGYHEVKMVMQSVDLHDTLSLEALESGIELLMNNAELSAEASGGKKNIIVKAAETLFDYMDFKGGVKITLDKRIPIAAGMAGGSTDAAATLRGINRLFGFGLSNTELEALAVKIGADVPFCVEGGTKLSEGIGEVLTTLPTPERTHIVICKPNVNVSTKDVYEGFDLLDNPYHPPVDDMVEAIKESDFDKIPKLMGNSLEAVTKKLYPVIGEIEKFMMDNGAYMALMSGSGPTVFGLADEDVCKNLCDKLSWKYPDYYVKGHYYG